MYIRTQRRRRPMASFREKRRGQNGWEELHHGGSVFKNREKGGHVSGKKTREKRAFGGNAPSMRRDGARKES